MALSDHTLGRLELLNEMLVGDIEGLLDALEIDIRQSFFSGSQSITGPCPIHGGDNPTGFACFKSGGWACWTRGCNRKFSGTLTGLVRGRLSFLRGSLVSLQETIRWTCSYLGVPPDSIEPDSELVASRRFAREVEQARLVSLKEKPLCTREQIAGRLCLSRYYTEHEDPRKRYASDTLEWFGVGFCNDPAKWFYNRTVVPVFGYGDDVVGALARSLYSQCPECGWYHQPGAACPDPKYGWKFAKWLNNKGFYREGTLYNWPAAQEEICRTNVAIVCEGPGDVWRLHEAGFRNSVALFGTLMTDRQQIMLESSGVTTVVVATDMDQAGRTASATIAKQLGKLFRVFVPELPRHDVGELTVDEVRCVFKGFL